MSCEGCIGVVQVFYIRCLGIHMGNEGFTDLDIGFIGPPPSTPQKGHSLYIPKCFLHVPDFPEALSLSYRRR